MERFFLSLKTERVWRRTYANRGGGAMQTTSQVKAVYSRNGLVTLFPSP
jgi:hypothetical protein